MSEQGHKSILFDHARKIQAYWARFGAQVQVDVVANPPSPEVRHAPTFTLRSNMVNGLPAGADVHLVNRLLKEARDVRHGYR